MPTWLWPGHLFMTIFWPANQPMVPCLWDVRRSSALIGLLDQEDRLGVIYPSKMAGSGHVERASFQDS